MSRQTIERRDWKSFLDGFSHRHEGWLVSIGIEKDPAQRQYLVRDTPLRGVLAETTDGVSLMVFTGGAQPHASHFANRPVSLVIEEDADGAEAELIIVEETGTRTVVEFRSPMRPELVDGLA